ncbi:alpha/beta hydrolase fold-3 domain-containing protein [Pseudozyma hubeiensis SY62]|uniref:Alpha/beta hydrolase fold-3 domain-containing protein n=1 Tax=Pseudozyma hubeiensis (strain SY62) TaxID=1305764 RepID=R9NWM4_PSEHS|nr:alpha/beta hydrolase fold-3 domain-containing protein [Pseudozyma hubeiensis SY62]GAC92939.1 alpha/beta hydrolase fold-3 domain-containing protein [Pseudozyma hubeiensis SY62]
MSNIVLEPAAQSFAEATSKPPFLFQIPPEEGRKIFNDVQKESINYADGITTEVIAFPDFSSKLIKPKTDNNAILPVVFYIHGGGWVFGSPNAFGRLLGEISKNVNAAVFAVDYTRSPEAKYPTALDQVWQAFEYILANSEKHNVDSGRIAIAGDSVGGNMAAVTALKDAGHRLRGQALLYPVCDFSFDSGSYNDFAKGYFLQRDAMKWFFEQYSTGVNDAEPNNSRISVLRTTKEVLSKAPPALILTAEADVLRDHAEEFASKLRSSGVQMNAGSRRFDVVLFGATGFTGKLVVQYLARHTDVNGWAIAGRSIERLEKLRVQFDLESSVGTIQAHANDRASLIAMASQARCVINVVGPFQMLGGAEVVSACVEAKCHYVDLSGETGYNEILIKRFHSSAKAAGLVIAPSCGLDSLPSDLTTYLACRHLLQGRTDSTITSATTTLKEAAPFSTGTLLSACDMADNDHRQLMFVDAGRLVHSHATSDQSIRFSWPKYSKHVGRYATSYMLSPHNIRTVYRTWSLLTDALSVEAYGPNFAYDDLLSSPGLFSGYIQALSQYLTGFILVNASSVRSIVRKFAKGGDGPSVQTQQKIQTDCRTVATASDGRSAMCTMIAPGDPVDDGDIHTILGAMVNDDHDHGGDDTPERTVTPPLPAANQDAAAATMPDSIKYTAELERFRLRLVEHPRLLVCTRPGCYLQLLLNIAYKEVSNHLKKVHHCQRYGTED